MTDLLKLKAESADDVTVIASVLQDAIARVGEVHYDATGRCVTVRASRFRHEDEEAKERVLCGLRIDSVLSVKARDIDRSDPEAMMVLLDVRFVADDTPPGGEVHLIFAGGGEMAVGVECVDMILADTEQSRKTDKIPLHPDVS